MAKPTALVVGGTGPTGPYIVDGLRDRGYAVTILHRGTHEIDEIADDVTHLHADPHFRETLDPELDGRTFDVTVATYGRLRHVAEATVGHTGQFVAVGGIGVYSGFFHTEHLSPPAMAVPTPEDGPLVESVEENRFQYLMVQAEEAALAAHPTGSLFRYPYVYGPRQLIPREWSVVRRIRDGRPFVLVPDGGLTLSTHGYAENLAHAVLLAVDRPDDAAGQVYNCADDDQLTLGQFVATIAAHLGVEVECLGIPGPVSEITQSLTVWGPDHRLVSTDKVRRQLGYRDVVPASVGIARTVDWLQANPPAPGDETEQRLGDAFNYDAEDRLAEIIGRFHTELAAVDTGKPDTVQHAYAHPKAPGERDHHGR